MMKPAFFSPDTLRSLHQICTVLENGEDDDFERLSSFLIPIKEDNLSQEHIKKQGYLLRKQGNHDIAIGFFWNLFCRDPTSVEHIKLMIETTQIYWKKYQHPEDLVAQRLMSRFLLLLYPDDQEGIRFSQNLSYPFFSAYLQY